MSASRERREPAHLGSQTSEEGAYMIKKHTKKVGHKTAEAVRGWFIVCSPGWEVGARP
jgi:hypothetical protein